MLYHLFDMLGDESTARLFGYISFRSLAAIMVSLIISLIFGGKIINYLKKKQFLEKERELGLPGQEIKEKTPSMGGLIIIMAIIVPCLLFAKLDNIYIQVMLLATIWMGGIGFIDDYLKLTKSKDGLSGKYKVLGQVGLGLIVALAMLYSDEVVVRMTMENAKLGGYDVVKDFSLNVDGVMVQMAHVKTTLTNMPFFKGNLIDYKNILFFLSENSEKWAPFIFIPVVIFIVTAVSNAANLTDGVDGLATGVSAIIGATLGVLTYVSSNTIFADYLNIMYIPHSEELVIFIACFLGACIGFLWYNAYPAKIFMGDTGSLMIGGVIASLAIMIRKELLIPILCGIFLVENVSVILQVSYFKYTRKKYGEGRRIFKMSPLHHHYQKSGIHESKIVTRFWIVGIALAVITMITLKIR